MRHRYKRDSVPLRLVEDLVLDVLCQYAWGDVHKAAMKEREIREGLAANNAAYEAANQKEGA